MKTYFATVCTVLLLLFTCSKKNQIFNQDDLTVTPSACQQKLLPGDYVCEVEIRKNKRRFLVHIPKRATDEGQSALILSFHGLSSNALEQGYLSKLSALSDQEGFIVVYPEGEGAISGWKVGFLGKNESGSEDIAFVKEIIRLLSSINAIDPNRIYATGLSNGGFLAHRLACEMSETIAAIAPVAASNTTLACSPKRAIPILSFHGKADNVVKMEEAPLFAILPPREAIENWVKRNSCEAESKPFLDEGEVSCERWSGCQQQSEVIFCLVENGGHTWPGGRVPESLGYTTMDVDATKMIWEFFQRHPLQK